MSEDIGTPSGAGAGGAATPSSNQSSGGFGGNSASNAPATSATPLSIKNDDLVLIEGQDKPVKFGEHFRGLQSQLTKRAQETAKYKAELARQAQALEEHKRQLQYAQQSQRGNGQQANNQPDLSQALRALPYLNGTDAAAVVEHVMGRVNAQQAALGQRDQAIIMLAQHIKQLQGQVGSMGSRTASQDFDTKITRWVKDIGLPEEATDLAKEIYLAYEGDDLDAEFPQMLKSRWEKIEGLVTSRQKQRAEAARNKPFVPGRGGQGSASRPLQLGKMSAKQITDQLWSSMEGTQE